MNRYKLTDWLPTTKKEALLRGWDDLDVVLFTGDAYIDHPSFGSAVIGRIIESMGFKVAMVPQPNWQDDLRDFKKFGVPNLFFAVTSGCMDSMINHYTANKRLRKDDSYTPGGKAGFRPDYAVSVYSSILKKLFPDVPIIAGGVEASLRRFTHYDYWSDSLKPSIISDGSIDLLVYGMGEKPIIELLELMKKGVPFTSLKTVHQTAIKVQSRDMIPINKNWEDMELHSHEECLLEKKKFGENHIIIERYSLNDNTRLIQRYGDSYIIINPKQKESHSDNIDTAFDLPYTRLPHPKYKDKGVPAYDMIRHSITLHRGCFGGCSFCSITMHQGKRILNRTEKSILQELKKITELEDFKGYISDMGGPTANMYMMKGEDQSKCNKCLKPSCLFPNICGNLVYDHKPLIDIYSKSEKTNGVKKIFVSSGIRYDLILSSDHKKSERYSCMEYIDRVVRNHTSGRLKAAPEHTSDHVLKLMRKPSYTLFEKFKSIFDKISKEAGLKQQIIPYFISSHPGSKIEDMAELVAVTKKSRYKLEQVQDFTPTPMTLSSTIYYTGIDPYTGYEVYSAKSKKERDAQRRLIFWWK
ncbi:MAG: YgiQ family radical SAM protein [Spirochaetes bacterium]|nr:YgiQ family radical SAM protein [Spirochaetota bacterium]